MRAGGANSIEIFDKTNWFETKPDSWHYGLEDTLPNGESTDTLFDKVSRLNNVRGEENAGSEGNMGVAVQKAPQLYAGAGESDDGAMHHSRRNYDGDILREWAVLTDDQRGRIVHKLGPLVRNNAETRKTVEGFGGLDRFAERIYNDFVERPPEKCISFNVELKQSSLLVPGYRFAEVLDLLRSQAPAFGVGAERSLDSAVRLC